MKILGWVGIVLVGFMVLPVSSPAYAASQTVVISQIFTGGGALNFRIGYDYIELFNRGTSAIDLQGWSLQYAVGTDAPWQKLTLSGTVQAGGYYLIRAAGSGTAGIAHFDLSYSLDLEPGDGKFALFSTDELATVNCPSSRADLVDFVGYGAATCAEGQVVPAPVPASAVVLARAAGGCIETDRNRSDFLTMPPLPRSSASSGNPCGGTAQQGARPFAVAEDGAVVLQTAGTLPGLTVGSAIIRPNSGSTTPAGIAIFSLQNSNGVISEASVPAAPLVSSGVFFGAITGSINTGLAIVNPHDEDVGVSFVLIDSNGSIRELPGITIPAKTQIARFLNDLPFSMSAPMQGTLMFSADRPIGIIALRGLTNERNEFLMTTLPILESSTVASPVPAQIPHFAVNEGWRTEVILINRVPSQANGTLDFVDPLGQPVEVRVGSLTGSSIPYSVVPQGSTRIIIGGDGTAIRVGSIRVTPELGSLTPTPLAVFSRSEGGVTVSEASVAAVQGSNFRTYVESAGTPGTPGWIGTGLAISNPGTSGVSVRLELLRLDGTDAGLSTIVQLPGSGQKAQYVNDFFPTLPASFQGTLRITALNGGISVVGLRTRMNQRRDLIATTTPPQDESIVPSGVEKFFPQIADSGGYTTQFILFSGAPDQSASGTLQFETVSGRPLPLEFR